MDFSGFSRIFMEWNGLRWGIEGGQWCLRGELMGFNDRFMVFHGELMGLYFNGRLMGFNGIHLQQISGTSWG